MSFEPELKLARQAALEAGQLLADLTERTVASSQGRDIKLEADKASEKIILARLAESPYPVLSEETPGDGTLPEGLHWIIDPLDGSYNFYRGLDDLCCVSVALWAGQRPLLGVVNRFMSGQLYEGRSGGGAFINGQPATASTVTRVDQASVATGFSVKGDFSEASLSRNLNTFKNFKKIRMLGAAALMSGYVGLGRVDAYFERDILLWDIAAGAALTLAGGGLIDLQIKDDYKCDLFCFANSKLRENYSRLAQ